MGAKTNQRKRIKNGVQKQILVNQILENGVQKQNQRKQILVKNGVQNTKL